MRLRRRVKVGEWVRSDYKRGAVQVVTNKYGPRIVCAGCAKHLDLHDLKSERWQWIQIAVAVLVLFGLLIAARL